MKGVVAARECVESLDAGHRGPGSRSSIGCRRRTSRSCRLEVKPITVGPQTYFEPQREALADLLESWWGVKLSESDKASFALIVYNGAGTPGIAGEAAQQLIRGGFRVVDTKNADNFNYKQTQIVVQDKDMAAGDAVKKVLGTGKVIDQPSDQDVADVIVIIGKDYKPSTTTTGP